MLNPPLPFTVHCTQSLRKQSRAISDSASLHTAPATAFWCVLPPTRCILLGSGGRQNYVTEVGSVCPHLISDALSERSYQNMWLSNNFRHLLCVLSANIKIKIHKLWGSPVATLCECYSGHLPQGKY
jgi:hypothetical protein